MSDKTGSKNQRYLFQTKTAVRLKEQRHHQPHFHSRAGRRILSLGDDDPSSNLIQIPPAAGCDSPSAPRVNVDDVHLLQLLKNVAGDRATALAKMGWTTAIPLASTIDSPERTNTKTSPQINFPGHGSGSDKVPIRVIWSELLERSSLDYISPVRKFNLAGSLEMSGVRLDELVR